MKAILIDPTNKTIAEVEFDGDFEQIYQLMDCQTFECIEIDRSNTLYIDEEGRFKDNRKLFTYAPYRRPLIGKALILGHNSEGESTAATVKLQDVINVVNFPRSANLTAFDKWLDRFILEKGFDRSHTFTHESKEFGTVFVPFNVLIEKIKGATRQEQKYIKNEIIRLDYKGVDIMDYLAHLATGLTK